MFNVLLCIDIGTTSLKAGLITARGEVVSFCSVPFEDSKNEFAACTWLGAFVKAVCELETQCAKNGCVVTVSTISISGNGPTVVADCGYTVFWNEDFSDIKIPDSPEAKKSLFMPKLLALKKRVPKIYKKSRFIFSGPEYLIYILTGEAVTILPEERFRAAYWDDEVCKVCGIDSEKLPPFIGIGDCCGLVNKEVLAELRAGTGHNLVFSQNCSVFAGGPDFVAALIGTGTLLSGRLCDRCGSSEGLNFCTDKILQGEGLRILPSVIPGLWNASYLIPNSGELSEAERLIEIERGINCLKRAADEAGARRLCFRGCTARWPAYGPAAGTGGSYSRPCQDAESAARTFSAGACACRCCDVLRRGGVGRRQRREGVARDGRASRRRRPGGGLRGDSRCEERREDACRSQRRRGVSAHGQEAIRRSGNRPQVQPHAVADALRHYDRLHALLLHAEELLVRHARSAAGLRHLEVHARKLPLLGRYRLRALQVRQRNHRRQGEPQEDVLLRACRLRPDKRRVRLRSADCGLFDDCACVDVRTAAGPQPVLSGNGLSAVCKADCVLDSAQGARDEDERLEHVAFDRRRTCRQDMRRHHGTWRGRRGEPGRRDVEVVLLVDGDSRSNRTSADARLAARNAKGRRPARPYRN